jgi:hypothetical protein
MHALPVPPSRRCADPTPVDGQPQDLGCDRLDHPVVAHRLNDQAAPTATGHRRAAASPDSEPLHRNPREASRTGELEVAPAVCGKAPAAERPVDAPVAGRSEQLSHLGVAPPSLPQDSRLEARCGRHRQGRRRLDLFWPDLLGLWLHSHRCHWIIWSRRRSGPQGHHRRYQQRRKDQIGGQEGNPKPAVPRRPGRFQQALLAASRCCICAPTCPPQHH